jgi:ssRNA-specific RNase YbeY (16S rRNA maturation enzyme)
LLHLLGFDHTKLSVKSQGLKMRLTGIPAELVPKLLA